MDIRKTKHIFVLLSICFSLEAFTQERDREDIADIIQQRVEFLVESSDQDEIDGFALESDLMYFYDNPINLNTTNYQELQVLGLMNDLQIIALLKHRTLNGEFMSIYELQAVDILDLNIIRMILPFVTVKQKTNIVSELTKTPFRHELALTYGRTLQESKGYIPDDTGATKYLGSPDYFALRFFGKSKNTSYGLVAEKDQGEEFFQGSQKNGFDHYSAHFFTKDIGIIKQLAIGDYRLEYGQGLSMWTSRAFNKGSDVYNIKRNGRMISPSRSIDGNYFMRGIAATLGNDNFETTIFTAQNTYDATIQNAENIQLGIDDEILLLSFRPNSYHRTLSEIAKKNTFKNYYLGLSPKYTYKNGNISAIISHKYNGEGQIQPEQDVYNQFVKIEFENSTQLGFAYEHNLNNTLLFGEISKNLIGGTAHSHGAIISLDPKLSLIMQYRNYPKNFLSQIANPIRESSNYNEKGFYVGTEIKFNPKWWMTGYIDWFENPWVNRSSSKPNVGYEYLAQLNYRPKKRTTLYVRYRLETKNRINSDLSLGEENIIVDRHNVRLNISHSPHKSWKLRTRIEYTRYDYVDTTSGLLFYQDLTYKPMMGKLSFVTRYALFDTEGWDTRIYAYENETLYTFLVPPHYHKGSRFYFLTTYKPVKGLMIQFKYGQSLFENRTEIGSGNNTIFGNRRSTVKLLVKYSF